MHPGTRRRTAYSTDVSYVGDGCQSSGITLKCDAKKALLCFVSLLFARSGQKGGRKPNQKSSGGSSRFSCQGSDIKKNYFKIRYADQFCLIRRGDT